MAASTSKRRLSDGQSKLPRNSSSKKGKAKETNPKPASTPGYPDSESREEDPWEHHSPWNWTSLTDPSPSRIPPIFTKDSSYFFSLAGSFVRIHSTITGLVVSTLTAPPSTEPGHPSEILTSAVINPQNHFQLLTGTLNGRILIWDFVNATLLQTISVGQPVHLICAHEQFKNTVFVAASRTRKKVASSDHAVVLQISLKPAKDSDKLSEVTAVGKIRSPTGLAISPNGAWLVATAGHTVYVAKTSALSAGFTKYVSPERLTCLAFHPVEEYFASGDEKGVVRLWFCLNDDLAVNVRGVEKRTQTRSLHWHAHSVSSITFTPNGAYLLSGGEEAVLVAWQLHTGKKEFVPRVGAPIGTISISKSLQSGEEEYLLGLTDATYAFVSSTSLKITRSYSRIKLDPAMPYESASTSKLLSVPITIHALTSTLVLPSSHPSSLQIYSPSSSTLVSELEVSSSNRVSRRDEKPLIPSRVERTVISSSGLWMATIDCREGDVGFPREVYLKFWFWERKHENWILNSRIDRPHGKHKVTDLCFSNNLHEGESLVSTGEDGRIKLWQLRKVKGSESSIWASLATLNFRSEKPTSISWAPDSSLFAIAVGPQVALYDPVTKMLLQTLTTPNYQRIQSAQFIGVEGRYILASASKSLIMWDLILSCVSWQCELPQPIEKVIPHPKETTFAVFHSPVPKDEGQETSVSIFSASSSKPSSVYTLPFSLRNVVYGNLQAASAISFFGVTKAWRVVSLGDEARPFGDDDLLPAARGINIQRQPQNRTLFQDIFGVSAFVDNSYDLPEIFSSTRKEDRHRAFGVPAFATPSLDTIFDPLIKSLLTVRTAEQDLDLEEKVADEDDMMEEDDDLLIASRPSSRLPYPGELESFTKLFRTCCISQGYSFPVSSSYSANSDEMTAPVSEVNGRVNGSKFKEVNGILQHPPTTAVPVLKKIPPSQGTADESSFVHSTLTSSPVVNGKKRKKLPS